MEKSLNLNIFIDSKSGFCFGVINAIGKAEEYLKNNNELYCLGEIVHNEAEIMRLENEGMITIDKERLAELKNSTVLFRAHGEPPESFNVAENNNNIIIDATCPIIHKINKLIINSHSNNENIFIYGKRNHPEIIGLVGQIDNKAIVFENIEELNNYELPQAITLYSQTTMSLSKFYEIVDYLRDKGIVVKLKDTICRQVSNREENLRRFCKRYDNIIFVAGKSSSNGKVLFDICKDTNTNTYFISNENELNKDWFEPNSTVGICGATSTPMWLMNKIKEILSQY